VRRSPSRGTGAPPIGKPAVPDLIKGLADNNQFVRLWSAHALGRIGPDASDAASVLGDLARSDASINVREAAQAALAKIGN
jgi:HEAT repeat protein